jgi:hypothetical protein
MGDHTRDQYARRERCLDIDHQDHSAFDVIREPEEDGTPAVFVMLGWLHAVGIILSAAIIYAALLWFAKLFLAP